MNIVFWILVGIGALFVYWILSFAFGIIGGIGSKMKNKFNKNIGKEEEKDNEK